MKTHLLIATLFCMAANVLGATFVNGLDPAHKVQVETVSAKGSCVVTFNGHKYYLDGNTIYLDGELTDQQAASSTFIYNNVKEAFEALNVGPESTSIKTLLIAPGVYWVDDPDDPADRATEDGSAPYGMTIDCPKIALVGLATKPEYVVLACNRGQTQGSVGNFTMLRLIGEYIEATNITFGNFCNVDLNYPLKKEYSRAKRKEAIVQAQLVHTNADRVFAKNCRFISRLNTNPITGGHRSLYQNCYVECTDDALAGSAVYLDCKFTFFSSKPFYNSAAYGAVFLNCDIETHVTDTQYFCKADGGITLIDTRIKTLDSKTVNIEFNYGPKNNTWYYSNVTVNGTSQNIKSGVDITNAYILNAYKTNVAGKAVYNIANLLGGRDDWDPLEQRNIIPAEYLNLPTHMIIKRNGKKAIVDGEKENLTAEFFLWGGYRAKEQEIQKVAFQGIIWQKPTVMSITPTGNFTTDIEANYKQPTAFSGYVSARVPSGLQARLGIDIAPYLYDAPSFATAPVITFDKSKKSLVVDYKLSEDVSGNANASDRSIITWYRYNAEDMSDTIPILRGNASLNAKSYPVGNADRNGFIMAKVTPRYNDTQSGESQNAVYTEGFKNSILPAIFTQESHYSTDFHNIPVGYQPKFVAGAWTFDAFKPADTKDYTWKPDPKHAWFYGEGVDGMKGQGLVQLTRGARCFYLPFREKTGDMKVTVKIDPGKTAGQGFGSATGQYLDIYIKFDPETLTGYAVRIERTPEWSNAVAFSIIKYTNGETRTIGKPVISNCFRSTCTVTIQMKGNELTATATSNALLPRPTDERVQTEVFLDASVAKNEFGGFGLQHTGSTGPSAAMIHNVEIDWK